MKDTTSFLLSLSASDLVFEEDDTEELLPNKYLQYLANYLVVPIPYCFLEAIYFDGPLKGGRGFHVYKSPIIGSKSLICVDLKIYDRTDQLDSISIGVICSNAQVARVRYLLNQFVKTAETVEVASFVEKTEIPQLTDKLRNYDA